jgi:hypothetical protein
MGLPSEAFKDKPAVGQADPGRERETLMIGRFSLAVLAYLAPTFLLGYVWHLILFEDYYKALQIYRDDIIVPFGFLAMLIQGTVFAWVYSKAFALRGGSWISRGFAYATAGAVLSWSFTTITVAAKNVMASVPDFLLIETAFTIVHWVIVGPLTALVFSGMATARGKPAAA